MPVSNVTVGVIDRTLYGNGIDYGSVTSLSCGDYKEIRGAATVKCVNGNWDFVNGEASSCHRKLSKHIKPQLQHKEINNVAMHNWKTQSGQSDQSSLSAGIKL